MTGIVTASKHSVTINLRGGERQIVEWKNFDSDADRLKVIESLSRMPGCTIAHVRNLFQMMAIRDGGGAVK